MEDAYCNIEQKSLLKDLERVLPKLQRVLPKPLLETVAILLALNCVTQELDEALTQCIFERMDMTCIDESVYVQAFQLTGAYQTRQEQLNYIRQLGGTIDSYLMNPWFFMAFKLVKMPGKLTGLSELIRLLDKGFAAAEGLEVAASDVINDIVLQEDAINRRITSGQVNPFSWDDCQQKLATVS